MWHWKNHPVKGIIFDVDGTLYSQPPVRRAMLLKLIRAYWWKPHGGWRTARLLSAFRKAQESLRGSEHLPPDLAAAQLAHALKGNPTRADQDLVERWMEREPLNVIAGAARPGLVDFFREAHQAGMRIGVFSDYPAAPKLAALGLTRYVDVVVSAQDPGVLRFKPHPAGLHVALEKLKLSPESAVYVGDRPDVDAPAAAAAGMPCFLFSEPVSAADSWTPITTFSSLAQFLTRNPA